MTGCSNFEDRLTMKCNLPLNNPAWPAWEAVRQPVHRSGEHSAAASLWRTFGESSSAAGDTPTWIHAVLLCHIPLDSRIPVSRGSNRAPRDASKLSEGIPAEPPREEEQQVWKKTTWTERRMRCAGQCEDRVSSKKVGQVASRAVGLRKVASRKRWMLAGELASCNA